MCGIVAILGGFAGARDAASAALDRITHRGPDGRGLWVSPDRQTVLGHVRLAINGGPDAAQPLISTDGSLVATVNGEFYDADSLRSRLIAAGHRFRTTSDSEVLLHLYREHGDDFLSHLRGDFAFVLWDESRRRAIAARDRFGVKPLVFTHHRGALLIASEAKALFAAGVPARWDEASILHLAAHQYLPAEQTFFGGVHNLAPGQRLTWTPEGLRTEMYWQQDWPTAPTVRPTDVAVEEVRARVQHAINIRANAAVPTASYLSGGLDSGIVTRVARDARRTLACFSVRFPTVSHDESEQAVALAKTLGVPIEIVPVDAEQMLQTLGPATFFSEGLTTNGQLPAKFTLAAAVRAAGYKVVLTGEGADEAFFGYPHLVQDWIDRGPAAEQALWNHQLAQRSIRSNGIMMPAGLPPPLPVVESRLGFVPTWVKSKAMLGQKIASLLNDDTRAKLQAFPAWEILLDGLAINAQCRGRSALAQSSYLWSRLALAGYILRTLGDGTEMAHGVEGRPPFLDHELFEFVRSLEDNLKIKAGQEKWVLRQAFSSMLPRARVDRPKHPFIAPPLTALIGDAGRARCRDLLASVDLPFFDRKRILRLLDKLPQMATSERAAVDPALMAALSAAELQRQFRLEVS